MNACVGYPAFCTASPVRGNSWEPLSKPTCRVRAGRRGVRRGTRVLRACSDGGADPVTAETAGEVAATPPAEAGASATNSAEEFAADIWNEVRSEFPGSPWAHDDYLQSPPEIFGTSGVDVADAMEFFRAREGTWSSWRVTHHLAFRRSESGSSEISMKCLEANDERILKLLDDNGIEHDAACGGCYVTWRATMAWDQEGENHEGSTVFALVPDPDNKRAGRIIRDRGYAEVVPIAGKYQLDNENALCLDTPYEGGGVEERFFFDGPDIVHRVSTVRRFGGLSNATFATETRLTNADGSPAKKREEVELTAEELELITSGKIFFIGGLPPKDVGSSPTGDEGSNANAPEGAFLSGSVARMSAAASAARAANKSGRPSPGSAFSTGFSDSSPRQSPPPPPEDDFDQRRAAAERAGIDLSKIPPSMRADFERSLELDAQMNTDEKSS